MKRDALCRAFCDNIQIRDVPAGIAVSTGFATANGDRIGFYVCRNETNGLYRIEDDGVTLPTLEASGVDFRSATRQIALEELQQEYGVSLDSDTREFIIESITEEFLPRAAMRFVAFSLRVRDFALMTEMRTAGSFRDDVKRMLSNALHGRVTMEENKPVSEALSDFIPDFVLRPTGRPPVGVFLGTSEARVLEALFVHMRARHEVKEPVSIIALLEKGRSVSAQVRRQATNRLTAVAEFRGDEVAAIHRIADEALGQTLH